MSELTQEMLKELLVYDANTGDFSWSVNNGPAKAGSYAGCIDGQKGYVRISIRGRSYYAHRLAWLYTHGVHPANQIDHINGVRYDNRLVNLRQVTNMQNRQNLAKSNGTSSKFMGVTWYAARNKWKAAIRYGGKSHHLGLFTSEQAAYEAYLLAKAKYHDFRSSRIPALAACGVEDEADI